MADQNTAAHQRPNLQQHLSGPAPAFSPTFSHPSPPNHMNFPSPAQQSPSMPYSQLPANKRPRLSPGVQTSYGQSNFSPVQDIRGGSPVNGLSMNGMMPAPAPPGSMGPPSRPVDKATDIRSLEDNLAGTGVNLDEEERQLTATSFPSFGHPTPGSSFLSQNNSFGTTSTNGSFDRPGSAGRQDSNYNYGANNYNVQSSSEQLTPEEVERRKENQANWQAGRHSQHELWNMFLAGDPLERKLQERTFENGIKSPKDGLYYATKGIDRPPQRTRVNGLDGASRIIDQGETILSTASGEVLGDIMKLISLAAKERMTGLLDQSARLAQERRDHSSGRVPTEWSSIAMVPSANPAEAEGDGETAAAPVLKRSHSQANGESAAPIDAPARHPAAEVFQKGSRSDRAAEEMRLAKRARRSASANPDVSRQGSVSTLTSADIAALSPMESDKKPTKKDKKLLESKFSEAQQHKSANETARGALGGIIGKKGKSYSWMTGGSNTPKSVSSPAPTASKASASIAAASSSSAPNGVRVNAGSRRSQFGDWDEDTEPGVQPRDVLLVLATDGKAPRSLMKGYNIPEGREGA